MKCKLCDLELFYDDLRQEAHCPTKPPKQWNSNRSSHYYIFPSSEVFLIGKFISSNLHYNKTCEIMDYDFYYTNKGIRIYLPFQLDFSKFKNYSAEQFYKKIKLYLLYK